MEIVFSRETTPNAQIDFPSQIENYFASSKSYCPITSYENYEDPDLTTSWSSSLEIAYTTTTPL